MKNLESFGVTEMTQSEIRETEGGIIWFVVVAALLIPTAAY